MGGERPPKGGVEGSGMGERGGKGGKASELVEQSFSIVWKISFLLLSASVSCSFSCDCGWVREGGRSFIFS